MNEPVDLPARSLRADVICSTAALESLRPEWEALYDSASATANPFLRWTWVRQWWRSVSERPGLPRTYLHILALRDIDGCLRCVVPLFLGTWRVGPISFRALRLYGFHTTLTDIRTVLIAPGWEAAAGEGLVNALLAHARQYHLCVLDGLSHDSEFTCSVASRLGTSCRQGPDLAAYVLPLPESWEALRASLTRNNRGSIQQGYNALKRDGRAYTFEVIRQPGELPGALDELFALHTARAAHTNGPRHHDYYADAHDRAFLREAAAELAADDLIRVCRLRVDGVVVASRLVLSAGDGLYLYHAGHDPTWDRYRVGTLLTAECIQMAIRAHARTIHLGTGTEPSKLRWSPQLELFEQFHIAAPTTGGELMSGAAWQIAATARRLRGRWPQHRWLTVGGLQPPTRP
jgi:CelD/BcsL family acetyltransferase involved in cellulose biosynthesis